MKTVLIIGIGAGDPEYLTIQAIRALNRADALFVMDKGSDRDDLVALRRQICDRYIDEPGYRLVETKDIERDLRGPSYRDDVRAWHDQRVDIYESLICDELEDGQTGGFLVWGDPALYDSTMRIIEQVAERMPSTLLVEVIPGISAVQSLAARHGITLHGVGAPVHITTGRRLAQGWPEGVDDVVVMLDGSCAFTTVDPTGVDIYWGAYLGTPDEMLVSGPLAEQVGPIQAVRAAARERKGWMFDTYLLRRRPAD